MFCRSFQYRGSEKPERVTLPTDGALRRRGSKFAGRDARVGGWWLLQLVRPGVAPTAALPGATRERRGVAIPPLRDGQAADARLPAARLADGLVQGEWTATTTNPRLRARLRAHANGLLNNGLSKVQTGFCAHIPRVNAFVRAAV